MATVIGQDGGVTYTVPIQRVGVSDTSGGPYAIQPYLWCSKLTLRIAPGMDVAILRYEPGDYAVQLDGGNGGAYPPLSLGRKYVKFQFTDPDDENYDSPIKTWHGRIEVTENDISGIDAGDTPSGPQTFTAFGILREWETTFIRTAQVLIRGGLKEIGRGLPFNVDPRGQYLDRGNRSDFKHGSTFVFNEDAAKTPLWTAKTAIEYLAEHYPPRDENENPTVDFSIAGQVDAPDWFDFTAPTDRQNVKSIVDRLLPANKLMGYYVTTDDSGGVIDATINVFTFAETIINVGDSKTIPANENQITLDFETAFDIDVATVRDNETTRREKVIVEGESIVSMFTITYDSTYGFQDGWTSSQETAVVDGAKNITGYSALSPDEQAIANTRARNALDLEHVFQRFVLSATFADRVKDERDDKEYNIAPDPTFLASIESNDTTKTFDYSLRGEPLFSAKRARLSRFLPVLEADGDEYRDPFVIFTVTTATDIEDRVFEFAHRLNANVGVENSDGASREFALNVAMLDKEIGIRFDSRSPQMIAKDRVNAAEPFPEKDDPALTENGALNFDGDNKFFATVAVEADDRVSAFAEVGVTGVNNQKRVLIVFEPDARLDLIVPGTITDLDDEGLPVFSDKGQIVRDDRERLQEIADSLLQWYSKTRQSLSLSYNQLDPNGVELGMLVTSIGNNYTISDVNSVVSKIEYDFDAVKTTIETQFAELDRS